MRGRLLAAALLILLPAIPAAAEETELKAEMARRRVLVQPRPAPETVTREAEQAAAEAAARERAVELGRQAARPLPARPDLRYDVYGAVQAANARGALRR